MIVAVIAAVLVFVLIVRKGGRKRKRKFSGDVFADLLKLRRPYKGPKFEVRINEEGWCY